jgi:hypothetical protein
MARTAAPARPSTFHIRIAAALQDWPSDKPPGKVMAYAFNREGRALGAAELDANGEAVIAVPAPPEPQDVRIVLGPATAEEQTQDLVDLVRRGAQEQHIRLDPKISEIAPVRFTIYQQVWFCWFRFCLVRGTLLKRHITGGVFVDYPVCHARVEIYEVDPLWIILTRLSDAAIDHLKQIVLAPVAPPMPRPIPMPDPAPLAGNTSRMALPVANAVATTPQAATEAAAALAQLGADHPLRRVAQLGNRQQFSQTLLKYPDLIRPLICLFYPHFVLIEKIGEVYTDACGHFQSLIFQGCNNHDVPDLYFRAYQRIFGFFDVQIYGPTPIYCHTWWNYVCGTEVTLYSTSPFAITCLPCPPVVGPDNWVLFMAIGNTSLKAIYGGGAGGATAANWGLLTSGAPWGGTLRPRLDFDASLRASLGVQFYQLSWRSGTSGDWIPFHTEVNRHYAHMVGTDLVISPYRLGPNPMVVGGKTLQLYEIPPAVPPIGQWTVANAVLDTENGELDSAVVSPGLAFNADGSMRAGTTDGSGLYQIELRLFDATGNDINIAAKNIKYVVPDTVSLSGTIHTVDAAGIAQPGGGTLVVGNTVVLTLHIDNNHCWASVAAPTTAPSGGAADACCGVVRYAASDNVTMPYVAYHPHNFATHTMDVYRSATNIFSQSGGVGSFSITDTTSDMMSRNLPPVCLNAPPCVMAAFSEHLAVYEMATDGWGSYLGYDAVADRAFALAPA